MKKLLLGLFLLFVAVETGLQVTSILRKSAHERSVEQYGDEIRVMVVGESTSYGLLLPKREDAYPFVLAETLERQLKKKVAVYNYSVPGQTSHEIMANVENYLANSRPHLVITHFGNNDFNPALNKYFNLQSSWSLPAFLSFSKVFKFFILWFQDYQYKKTGVRVSEDGTRVFFLENKLENSKEASKETTDRITQELFKNYGDVIKKVNKENIPIIMVSYFNTFFDNRLTLNKVSRSFNVPLVDLSSRNIERDLLVQDLWHPSKRGHEFIAQKLFQTIEQQNFLKLKASPPQ